LGVGLVFANPNNWAQKVIIDPLAYSIFQSQGAGAPGAVGPPVGYVLQTAFDGSIDTSLNPPEHDVPVFSGGWPAYNNGPQQLGFTKGSRGSEGPNG